MTEKKKKEKKGIKLEIEIPQGAEVSINNGFVEIKGGKGEVKRRFPLDNIRIEKKDNKISLSSNSSRRKEKELLGSVKGHIQNMIRGVTEGITYRMKIVYSHFPMAVKVQGNRMSIDNFLGEKHPRVVDVLSGVEIEVKGQDIILKGIDKEAVSQTAANIEQTTRIRDRDPRVFQDGIYIVEKDGKVLA